MDKGFRKQNIIDKFESSIWTERYYGDSDFELVVPATPDMIQQLPTDTFIGLEGSKEVMLLDSIDIKEGNMTVSGQGLVPFLNNRFIRVTAAHEDQYWNLTGGPPGWALWAIVYYMCISGAYPVGVPNPGDFVIPGLGLGGYDTSGDVVTLAVPYGPVYDAMRDIATTYQIGLKITLESATDTAYSLAFWAYKGLDRTSGQSVNPIVRFSPQMDTLSDIEELQSIANYKTVVYSYAPENPNELATVPGQSNVSGNPTGFDFRALMTFEQDITTDQVGSDPAVLLSLLNARAASALDNNRAIKTVDGEITPLHQFQYGVDYTLGDIIEVQGNSGVVQSSRVTEYIRTEDTSGETAYPTVAMLD
jgi:hypothetical protein